MKKFKIIWQNQKNAVRQTTVLGKSCFEAKSEAVRKFSLDPHSVIRVVELEH